MGSVRFFGGDESQPNTTGRKNYKLPRKLLVDDRVPKKLRSATKKRGRKSIIPPLPISRKQHHMSNGVEPMWEDGGKKSRLNMKQGEMITKDEEEVAETLYTLADMFSNTANTLKIKSSTTVETRSSITAAEGVVTEVLKLQDESRNTSTSIALEAASHSSVLINSTAQDVKFQSLDDSKQPESPFSKHDHPKEKYKGVLSSENVFPAWFESTKSTSFNADKIEPKKSWKSCSAHVHIAHLINISQKSEKKEGLLQKQPTQLKQEPQVIIDNQKREINSTHSVLPFNTFTHSASEKDSPDFGIAILSHKKLLQDQQQASRTSVLCSSLKQGSDLLSLAGGGEGISRAGHSREALKLFHASYQQPQNHAAMLSSLPQIGNSSVFHGRALAAAATQVSYRHSPYLSNNVSSSLMAQQLDSQQQKWISQLRAQYNNPASNLQDWQNRVRDSPSVLNYAEANFSHFYSALGSKYQHFSPPQWQLMPINSSVTHLRQNSTFKRNGAVLCADNIQQLQLLCKQHL